MPVLQLTKRNIDKVPHTVTGQVDYFDTELKGLYLRVGMSSKTFYVMVDVMDIATRKYKKARAKIGRYGELTPDQARQRAPEIMQRLRARKPAIEGEIPTLRDLYNRYIKDKKLKASTAAGYKIYFEGENGAKFQTWMDIPLPRLMQVLTPDVVIQRYQEVLDSSGKGAASNAFKMLQAIINYGLVLYPQHISKNPVRVISDASLWPEIKARTASLEAEQFKPLYESLMTFSAVHRDCYLFALYQGVRPDEAHSLRWVDVDLEKKLFDQTWMASQTKHRGLLPLSRQTTAILERRKAVMLEGDIWVFPSESGRSKSGHVILRADKMRSKTGLEITPHILRSAFITTGERLRMRREDINRLTNHIDQTVTGRHYCRIGVEDLRAPLQLIANEIERLMTEGVSVKVIPISAAKAA